jgi:hypothetical protein
VDSKASEADAKTARIANMPNPVLVGEELSAAHAGNKITAHGEPLAVGWIFLPRFFELDF